METQNIVNLLNDSCNEFSKFATRKLLITKTMESMVKVPPLSLKQKLLNDFCKITQMLMCL